MCIRDRLSAARRFRGSGEVLLVSQRVESAGLTRVRAAGKRDFNSGVGRQVANIRRAGNEVRLLIIQVSQKVISINSANGGEYT